MIELMDRDGYLGDVCYRFSSNLPSYVVMLAHGFNTSLGSGVETDHGSKYSELGSYGPIYHYGVLNLALLSVYVSNEVYSSYRVSAGRDSDINYEFIHESGRVVDRHFCIYEFEY